MLKQIPSSISEVEMESPISVNMDISHLIEKWETEIISKAKEEENVDEHVKVLMKNVFRNSNTVQNTREELKKQKGTKWVPILIASESVESAVHQFQMFKRKGSVEARSFLSVAYIKLGKKKIE